MKKLYKVLGLACAMTLAVACKPEDLTKNLDIQVNVDLMNQMKFVQVEDYSDPNAEILGLEIEFLGPNASLVFDVSGNEEVTVSDGIFSFGILNEASDPVVLVPVKLSAPGYKTKIVNMKFDGSGLSSEKISLLNLNSLPNNIEKADYNVTLNNGQTTQAESVNFNGAAAGVPNIDLDIPAGTTFKDANGNVISGGSLAINLLTYEQHSVEEKIFFKGGLEQDNVIGPDGTAGPAILIPNGTLDLEMNLNGQEVHSFNQPLSLTMQLDRPVYKYGDTVFAQVGDSVAIFSQTGDGDFQFEHFATVSNSSTEPILNLNISHLSTYTAAVYTKVDDEDFCNKTIDFSAYPYSSYKVAYIMEDIYDVSQDEKLYHTAVYNLPPSKQISYSFGLSENRSIGTKLLVSLTDMHIFTPDTPDDELLTADPVAIIRTSAKCTPDVIEYFGVPPVTRYYKSLLVCPTDTSKKMGRTFPILYKKPGETKYEHLTWVMNGDAKTELLKQNETYHFAYKILGIVPYDTITIDKIYYRETFPSTIACGN